MGAPIFYYNDNEICAYKKGLKFYKFSGIKYMYKKACIPVIILSCGVVAEYADHVCSTLLMLHVSAFLCL